MINSGGFKTKMIKKYLKKMNKKIINDMIKWIEKNNKENNKIVFAGAPFFLYAVAKKLGEQGKSFDFSNKGAILTGGGWKVQENHRISVADFRKQMKEFLGINSEYCLDAYGMVEGNGFGHPTHIDQPCNHIQTHHNPRHTAG